MTRSTMANLISELRGMTNTADDDYTVNGTLYWSDDQLQAVLDKYRVDYFDLEMMPVAETASGGSVIYTRYLTGQRNWEQTEGGTALFVVKDATWNVSGTANWTADYMRGEVIFSANTAGVGYYVTGRAYNLNRAAADIWRQKASQVVSASYSWSSDNMRVDKSGLRQEYFNMATFYETQAGPNIVRVRRGDE